LRTKFVLTNILMFYYYFIYFHFYFTFFSAFHLNAKETENTGS
jgi:hypothetical protein